jgi:hypothetical protein
MVEREYMSVYTNTSNNINTIQASKNVVLLGILLITLSACELEFRGRK